MAEQIKSKKQYTMLDLGKFLCALLILFYHYFSEHGPIPFVVEEVLSLYAVAVALFMTISGFLMFNKLEDIAEQAERKNCVIQQVTRIIKIYALWSIIYIVYNISRWAPSEITVPFIIREIRHWVFHSTFYTIWFMPSLAIGLWTAFWMTEKVQSVVVHIFAVGMYFAGALALTYSAVGERIAVYAFFPDFLNNWLGGPRGWLTFGFPLVMVGRCMVKIMRRTDVICKEKIFFWMALSIGAVIMMLIEALTLRYFFGHTGIDMTMMMPLSVFSILGFLLSAQIPSGQYLHWLRKMSVLVFMTQRIFLTVIPDMLPQEIMDMVFRNNYFGAVIICGGVLVFSASIILLSRKIRWMRNLY